MLPETHLRLVKCGVNKAARPGETDEVRKERLRCIEAAAAVMDEYYPHRAWPGIVITIAICAALAATLLALDVMVHTAVGDALPPLFHIALDVLAAALTGWFCTLVISDRYAP